MQLARKVVANTAILYARMLITLVLTLYTTRAVLQEVGQDGFGLYVALTSVVMLLSFLNGAVAVTTQRFLAHAEGTGSAKKKKEIFCVSLLLHIGLAFAAVAILMVAKDPVINSILSPESPLSSEVGKVYTLVTIGFAVLIIQTPYDSAMLVRASILPFAIFNVLEVILKALSAYSLFYIEQQILTAYSYQMIGIAVVGLIGKAIYNTRKFPECNVRPGDLERMTSKEVGSFATWAALGSATSQISNYGQGVVLAAFYSPAVNAAQGVTSQLSGQISALATSLVKVVNPVIARSEGAGNKEQLRFATIFGSKIGFFLLLVMYIPALVETDLLFELWLVQTPPYAAAFLRLLLLRNLIEQLFITLVSAINAEGNVKGYYIGSSALSALPLPISALFAYMGAEPTILYVVFLIYSVFASLLIMNIGSKVCEVSSGYILNHVVLRCVLVAVSTFFLSLVPYQFMAESALRLVLVTLISLPATLLFGYLVGLSSEERQLIREFARATLIRTKMIRIGRR